MEFAITSCVSANSWTERCAASSTVITSSATHCSSQSNGVKSERRLRICWRKRVRNAGVRSGPRCTNADRRRGDAPDTLHGEQARHPLVGGRAIGDVARGAERHSTDALEISHAQHRRNRPELAQRERRHALIFGDHRARRSSRRAARRCGRSARRRCRRSADSRRERRRRRASGAPGSIPPGSVARISGTCSSTTKKLSRSQAPAGPTSAPAADASASVSRAAMSARSVASSRESSGPAIVALDPAGPRPGRSCAAAPAFARASRDAWRRTAPLHRTPIGRVRARGGQVAWVIRHAALSVQDDAAPVTRPAARARLRRRSAR